MQVFDDSSEPTSMNFLTLTKVSQSVNSSYLAHLSIQEPSAKAQLLHSTFLTEVNYLSRLFKNICVNLVFVNQRFSCISKNLILIHL